MYKSCPFYKFFFQNQRPQSSRMFTTQRRINCCAALRNARETRWRVRYRAHERHTRSGDTPAC